MKKLLASAFIFGLSCVVGCTPPKRVMTVDADKAIIDARSVLRQSAESDSPATRSHAMEALAACKGKDAGAVFVQALSDKHPAVRFAAAMAIGDTRYEPAAEELRKIADDEKTNKNILCACIYALYRVGDGSRCGRLVEFLFDSSNGVRANAAMVMGLMGEPSAVRPLNSALEDEKSPAVRLNMEEALARLGDKRTAVRMESYAKGLFLEDKMVAIPIIAKTRSPRSVALLKGLMEEGNPPRVRVMSAGMLAKIGKNDDKIFELCTEAARDPKGMLESWAGKENRISPVVVASLQRLAAMSLGWTRNDAAVDTLVELMDNPDGAVRVSAAMSVLHLLGNRTVKKNAPSHKRSDERSSRTKPSQQSQPEMLPASGKD